MSDIKCRFCKQPTDHSGNVCIFCKLKEREAENADLCDICQKPMIAENSADDFLHRIWSVHRDCAKNDFSLD